jgi:hypothetical protein
MFLDNNIKYWMINSTCFVFNIPITGIVAVVGKLILFRFSKTTANNYWNLNDTEGGRGHSTKTLTSQVLLNSIRKGYSSHPLALKRTSCQARIGGGGGGASGVPPYLKKIV